jgi:hypothetical protein
MDWHASKPKWALVSSVGQGSAIKRVGFEGDLGQEEIGRSGMVNGSSNDWLFL